MENKALTVAQKKATHYKVRSSLEMSVKDVDTTKRTVQFILNTYNYFDSDKDVLVIGCSAKSIQEHGPDAGEGVRKIKHAKSHDWTLLPGMMKVLKETNIDGNECLYGESKLLNTTLGNDTLLEYQEGVWDNHSIGFQYLQLEYIENNSSNWDKVLSTLINPDDANKEGYLYLVKEIALYEGSCVMLGANQLTPFLGCKADDFEGSLGKLVKRLDILEKQLRSGKQSDETMEIYAMQVLQIKQLLIEVELPGVKDTLNEPSKPATIDYGKLAEAFNINN
jgi:phage head maturation protease